MANRFQDQTILETRRLVLQTWSPDDLGPALAIFSDAAVMKYLAAGLPFSEEETREFLEWALRYQEENGFCRWKVIEKSTSQIVGSCGFARPHGTEEVELGYALRHDQWGRGFATEAANACKTFGVTHLGFSEMIALTDAENVGSRRILEKIGFHERGYEIHKGKDVLVYAATVAV